MLPKTKAKKAIEKFFDELNEPTGEEQENSDFSGYTSFSDFIMDEGGGVKEIAGIPFEFVYTGSDDRIGAEVGDGGVLIWVFKVDGVLYSVEGYYSSWDSSGIDDEYDWKEVELATREVQYYKQVTKTKKKTIN